MIDDTYPRLDTLAFLLAPLLIMLPGWLVPLAVSACLSYATMRRWRT